DLTIHRNCSGFLCIPVLQGYSIFVNEQYVSTFISKNLPNYSKSDIGARLEKKLIQGNYTFTLEKDGYKKITKSIYIAGTSSKEIRTLLFPFNVDLIINSVPQGAEVYIDGKLIPMKTQVLCSIDMGKHYVRITKEGFEDLGNDKEMQVLGQCNLDFSQDTQNIDKRYWEFQESKEAQTKTYSLTGNFWKNVTIKSRPERASIYIDGKSTPWGVTPVKNQPLLAGEHSIELKKPGFVSYTDTLNITGETDIDICPVLKKELFFNAYEKNNPGSDIGALVTIQGTEIKNKKTPFKESLPLGIYKITFENPPMYKTIKQKEYDVETQVNIVGTLELQDPFVDIKVLDENKKIITDANIWLNDVWKSDVETTEEWKGHWRKYLKPDNYVICVNTAEKKYKTWVKEVSLKPGDRVYFEAILLPADDGILIVDIKPYYDADVFFDGKSKGKTSCKITGIPQGKHSVKIEHSNFDVLEEEIEFTKPGEQIILKLKERNDGSVSIIQQKK
ncbi:MAG: PEGA domain-containing protein, partial [Elusimicrobiota bacterium]